MKYTDNINIRVRMQKVFLYVCLDSEGWVHSGLTTAKDRNEVIENIWGNFGGVTHVMVDSVPELLPVWDETETHLLRFARVGIDLAYGYGFTAGRPFDEPSISCESCARHGDCLHKQTDGLVCCEDWKARA